MTCDAQTLISAARCFECIPSGRQRSVQTLLLARIAGVSTDPNTLSALATCLRCLDGMSGAVQLYLLQLLGANIVAASIVLQSPNLTLFVLTVDTDGAVGTAITVLPATGLVLQSPDSTSWNITVGDAGELSMAVTGLAPRVAVLTASNSARFSLTISNAGELSTTAI